MVSEEEKRKTDLKKRRKNRKKTVFFQKAKIERFQIAAHTIRRFGPCRMQLD